MDNKKQTFTEVLAEIAAIGKEYFGLNDNKQTFVDYKAADGSIIRTDAPELAIGAKLQVVTPDGVMDIPADVTELAIDINGTPSNVYLENGVVTGIEPVAAEGTEEAAPMADPNAPMQMSTDEFNAKIASLEERIAALEAAGQLSTQEVEKTNLTIAELAQKNAAQNDLNKKLFGLIEKLAEAPSVSPTATAKEKFSKPTTTLSEMDEFRKSYFNY